ncbi:MAG: hypothetical protein K6B38_10375 [Ruminococcus sp.]|nr:hypothetical protein [Ruminococcus sp.]
MKKEIFKRRSAAIVAAAFMATAMTAGSNSGLFPVSTGGKVMAAEITEADSVKVESAGGWNEMLYIVLTGITSSDVTGVSYSGPSNGTFSADDLEYLVRDTQQGVRVDIVGLQAGDYNVSLTTSKGEITKSGIKVTAQDRSGYAHFKYTDGVGAYTDSGELKQDAIILYVTDENKDTVSVTSKDGTTVTGIGNILNSAGQDMGDGKTSGGSTVTNTNSGIIKKLAEDGTPLVIRIVGNVTAPSGLTAYNTTDYGGLKGDNGFMARMRSGKDITIEGIGTDACINGWGLHFICEESAPEFGKNFEVRNLAFRNVPEDAVGMEGVQANGVVTASVERCWIHNNEFYVPNIEKPAESDKKQGDGACDFKRGQYFTNSYNYYEGYHKTNLVGANDSNLQYNISFHNNYWKDCAARGPMARKANIHLYNNIYEHQTDVGQDSRADSYFFSEYNLFENCDDCTVIKSGGTIKSFNDSFVNCEHETTGKVVSSRDEAVSNNNKYPDFDTNAEFSYIPSGDYILETDTTKLKAEFEVDGGTMDEPDANAEVIEVPVISDISGDVNGDGEFNIADAVALQAFLLGRTQTLANWKNADLCKDDQLDVFDIMFMRRSLIEI